jgi:hypothetical protein
MVSKIGNSRTSAGTASAEMTPARPDAPLTMVSAAKLPPMNRLPLSPRKMEAGWKL